MFGDYFVLIFLASIGTYQIVAVPARLEGIWFFNRPGLQYAFGALLLIGAFGWFFSSEDRNVQHRVEGSQQLALFLLAIIVGWIATLVVSSVIEARVSSGEEQSGKGRQSLSGIEALKTKTFFQAVAATMKKAGKGQE